MVIQKVEARVWECDGCGKIVTVSDYEVEPDWYVGTVMGYAQLDWLACSKRCISKAVVFQLETEKLGDRE